MNWPSFLRHQICKEGQEKIQIDCRFTNYIDDLLCELAIKLDANSPLDQVRMEILSPVWIMRLLPNMEDLLCCYSTPVCD